MREQEAKKAEAKPKTEKPKEKPKEEKAKQDAKAPTEAPRKKRSLRLNERKEGPEGSSWRPIRD